MSDTLLELEPVLMDESVDFIKRENFAPGSKPKYGGSLVDIYTLLVDQWNNDVLEAYKAKDLSTLETSFADYASKELNISNKKVNSQYYGLTARNRLDEKFIDVVEFRKQLAKELITEANQGLKYTNLKDIASKLGPNYTNATLKTLITRIPEIPELDTYDVKVNKAFQKIFVEVDPEKVLAKDFFNPAKKIQDVVGRGSDKSKVGAADPTGVRPETGLPRFRTETIYKALKNNPDYKDLGFEKIFNRLRTPAFQKVVLKSDTPWTLSDVSYAVDNNLNLKNPKSIDERAINFAIRSKVQGNPNIEIFSREGDRLVKLTNPKNAQINNYYDIVFRMDGKNYGLMGDLPGVINLQKDGRQLPEFKNFYAKAAAKDELAQRTKFPDGTDIINPRTGNPSTFEELMKDTYYFGRGKKRGYAMAFPYDLEHLDIKNDPFGIIKPENLRILPKRINLSVGDKTKIGEDVIKKTGYFFEKDLPFDQQLNNLMDREKNLAQKVLVFDEEGNHIGRRLDTAGKAAKKQIELRGVKQLGEKKLTALEELASRAGSGVDPILLGKATFEEILKPGAKIGLRGAATLADLAISAGKGGTGLALGALLEADPIITGMTEGKDFGQTARDTFIGTAIDAIPGVNLGSLNEDLLKLADTEEQRVGIQNLIDYQKDYDRFTKDLNAFKSYRGLDQISLDELGLTATDLVDMENQLAKRFEDIQTRAPKVYNPGVLSLVRDVARKEAEKRKANLEGIQGLIFGNRMLKDPNFIENQIQQILAASTGAQGATDSYTDNYRFLPQEQLSPEELDERFDMEGGIMAAEGGRIGFADGPKDPKRRLFMKIMGGIMSLPFIPKFMKQADVAKPIVKVAGSSTKMPEWFPTLINKVMFGGTGKKIDADLNNI